MKTVTSAHNSPATHAVDNEIRGGGYLQLEPNSGNFQPVDREEFEMFEHDEACLKTQTVKKRLPELLWGLILAQDLK